MSFDQKKNDNMEIDELNIKSHLNTSLDMEGISVSEDLINRTLEAIRKQSQETKTTVATAPTEVKEEPVSKTERKVIPWTRYIRNFAVVAAACLILIVGVKSQEFGRKDSTKESAPSTDNSVSLDRALSKEAPEVDTQKADEAAAGSTASEFSVKADGQQAQLKMNADATTAADTAADSEMAEADNSGTGTMGIASNEETATAPMESSAYSDIYTLSFRDICPIVPETAESVNITEASSDNSVFLSESTDINEFYSLMDLNSFAEGSESSGVNNYIIRINSNGASFTLTVEDNYILTSYTFGEEKTDGRYVTGNHQQLLQDLGAFYSKFNK
jgi:negative regulator of sigma E activity